MTKNSFSTTWKRSTQPRKQRKYRHNAPLHVKQKMVHVHLSPALRKKYGTRNVQIKTGDKVKILRGESKGKEGKVEKVSLKYGRAFITGLEKIKTDGSKVNAPFDPSNLMIIELNLDDKKRKTKLESKTKGAKKEEKEAVENVKEVKEDTKEKTSEATSEVKKEKIEKK